MEFHRYPHVIPALFNGHEFGPPRDFTLASTCTWIGHPVSGLQHATTALLRLAFATAPVLQHLNLATYRNSLARSTKSTWSLALPLLVSIRFQVLFHSPPGVLFTFPSRYYALSVAIQCLGLEGGPPGFPQDSSCLVVLWILLISLVFNLRGFYTVLPTFPGSSDKPLRLNAVLNPGEPQLPGLPSALFARRYCGHLV